MRILLGSANIIRYNEACNILKYKNTKWIADVKFIFAYVFKNFTLQACFKNIVKLRFFKNNIQLLYKIQRIINNILIFLFA